MPHRLLTTLVATALLLLGAGAAPAATAPRAAERTRACQDLHQIGRAAYVRWRGMTIFTVRQYASPSCGLRYGEAYAWRQFRVRHVRYELGVALFDHTHDRYLGARQFTNGTGAAFWSAGVAARGACTSAIVEVWPPGDDLGAVSTTVC